MNYSKMQLLYDKKKAVALGKIFDIGLKAIRENNWVKVDACAEAHKMISKQNLVQYLFARKLAGTGQGLNGI